MEFTTCFYLHTLTSCRRNVNYLFCLSLCRSVTQAEHRPPQVIVSSVIPHRGPQVIFLLSSRGLTTGPRSYTTFITAQLMRGNPVNHTLYKTQRVLSFPRRREQGLSPPVITPHTCIIPRMALWYTNQLQAQD